MANIHGVLFGGPPSGDTFGPTWKELQAAAPELGGSAGRGGGPVARVMTIRRPTAEDGAAMWALVRDLPDLEENSLYAYLLLGLDFAGTCRVAVEGGRVLGLVAGYRPPAAPETLFVWQVGVHPDGPAAGPGLADDPGHSGGARRTPGSASWRPRWPRGTGLSDRLFRGLAARAGNRVRTRPRDSRRRHFGPQDHAPERRYRIGPLGRKA